MDPEAPLDRPISTDRPLFLDGHPGSDQRNRPARIAALILGLLLVIVVAGLLSLSGPRSSRRPATGSGVTASTAVRTPEPSNAPEPPGDPDGPLPDPFE